MGRIKEYLSSNWQVSTLVFGSYAMFLFVIGLQLTLNFSFIAEIDRKTKKIFELETQIYRLKNSPPTENISIYKYDPSFSDLYWKEKGILQKILTFNQRTISP